MKKIISLILIVTMWVGVAAFAWIKPPAASSEEERRPLEQFPTVTVDSKKKKKKKVWIAATMKGRFYGGGMNAAPMQDRNSADGKVTVIVWHGTGRLRTLMIFPTIFKGGHVKYTKHIDILQGHDVTVRFDEPCALQIDGETYLNVTQYSVKSSAAVAEAKQKEAVTV